MSDMCKHTPIMSCWKDTLPQVYLSGKTYSKCKLIKRVAR